MIVNIISKVYGTSTKNFNDDGTDLGLVNLETLGFKAFFERNNHSMIIIRGDLDS